MPAPAAARRGRRRGDDVDRLGGEGALQYSERVPLVVVCSLQLPAVYAWELAEVERLAKDAETRLVTRLEPWQARFPGVDLACRAPGQSPAVALLEAAPDTEVVVVGRYAGTHHLGGLGAAHRAAGAAPRQLSGGRG